MERPLSENLNFQYECKGCVLLLGSRHGGPQRPPKTVYRPLSTAILEESLESGGLKPSVMNSCENVQAKCQWSTKFDRNAGDG